MTSLLKDLLWRLYRHTGPLHALALRARMIRNHGITGGRCRFAQLPPGDLSPADREIRHDQTHLLQQWRRYGNVFKRQLRHTLLIGLVGNSYGRRFLSENEDRLESHAKELRRLFPVGHLRGMTGDTHRHYRRAFVHAIRPEVMIACDPEIREVANAELSSLAERSGGETVHTPPLMAGLRAITTRSLLRLLLGVDPDDPLSADLTGAYNRFAGEYAPARRYDDPEAETFEEIRAAVHALIAHLKDSEVSVAQNSVLGQLVTQDAIDDTVVGNLIYMLESGRFDLYSLLRWIVKYLTENPLVVSKVGREIRDTESGPSAFASAVVMETLRCNQSEAIRRRLLSDTEFDGFFLPEGSQVRICVWEGHKDPEAFPQPFKFDPDRFVSGSYAIDQYAPFGLDKHRCVAADLVVRLAALFVEELCRHFALEPVNDGEPVRGVYHWEPSRNFSIRLLPLERPRTAT